VELLVGIDRSSPSNALATSFGGRFSRGLLAGVRLGDDLQTGSPTLSSLGGQRPYSNSPIAGALLQVDLHADLCLEADGIYRPLHATVFPSALGPGGHYAVLTWEFPAPAKYRFHAGHGWRPSVEVGPSFRLDGNFNGPTPSHYGITTGTGCGGAGLEIEDRAGRALYPMG
jgi:hypothetical protein